MSASIAIISYNGKLRVPYLLRSIIETTSKSGVQELDIVLVDDGSDKKTVKLLDTVCKATNTRFYANETNLGITRSWNRAVQECKHENIILLNDDLIMTPHWYTAMNYFLDNNPNVGCAGFPTFFMLTSDMPKYFDAKFLPPRDAHTRRLLPYEKYEDQLKQQDDVPGACVVAVGCSFGFRKSRWKEIGGFDENIKSMYEDYIFNYEMMLHGYQNYQLRFPIIYHVLSGTFMANPELKGREEVQKSEQYFINKYGGKIGEVADPYFEKHRVACDVKYLNSKLEYAEAPCCL